MVYQVKTVVFDLGPQWMAEAEALMGGLRACGIHTVAPGRIADDSAWREGERFLVLTDNPVHAVNLASQGIVCIGCQKEANRYFEGASFVVECLKDLDSRTIEETFCHGTGLPMTVTQTQRLVIREIADEDLVFLEQLGHSDGMQLAVEKEEDGDGPLDAERLVAYIRHVYRLYGYGLWIVLKKDGERIGVCGLGDGNEEEIERDGPTLQLQYAVAPAFRRQGYAFEMCCGVMEYAREFLPEWGSLWLRIRTGNIPSLCLAEKLGFQYRKKTGDQLFYQYGLQNTDRNEKL
jgi:RimJ/RimL family protein N-acetyltransferase